MSRSRSRSADRRERRDERGDDRSRERERERERDRDRHDDRDEPRDERHGRRRGRYDDDNGEKPDIMEVSESDAAFLLGRKGATKEKIARVAEAVLDLDEKDLILEVRGRPEAREKAKLYAKVVMAQRVGPVSIDFDEKDRDDLSLVPVPADCVGYVTGKKGTVLRSIEEEWTTIMFFVENAKGRKLKSEIQEHLAIFGAERNRRGAELKIMSAVEGKSKGFYTKAVTDYFDPRDMFSTDYYRIPEEDFSYALGSQGTTRRKLAIASGAVMEYVGRIAFMSGTLAQRKRVYEYLRWLCDQRVKSVTVDTDGRDDVTVLHIPYEYVGLVTGSKGRTLRQVEEDTRTFCFVEGLNRESRGEGTGERLLIFAENPRSRERAKEIILRRIDDHKSGRLYRGGGHDSRDYGDESYRYRWWDYDSRNSRGYYDRDRPERYDDYDRGRDDRYRDRYYDDRRDRYDDRHDDRRDRHYRDDDHYGSDARNGRR
ncbi:unnamed protein product [Vitrella brassicaformis CCMP3155]|uniref:K Homology domain-containing protein n=1 Tax=Vitrella brassicaformis (strain CCMP3155) TaxID=1169540 RepID=A0A0G4F6Q4_VITBC|nr:unnamed protein product [Vitrella brassicaformis CCMP3155]|mmetsp:Transcript_10818/g.26233  ORF Transcript_10818/g.26233 Transcript_10818/m.26233 type:complete len:484 (-) Transcript_10818:448-1899(-)|eukprot:CEM08111.1 unnamed protein product [Vitrella brassicaformis CCMP3155]